MLQKFILFYCLHWLKLDFLSLNLEEKRPISRFENSMRSIQVWKTIQFEVFKQEKMKRKLVIKLHAIDTFAKFFPIRLYVRFVCLFLQDREKIPKQHLGETVEELKRFNARRKLKGAVQAIAGGLANDPLCGTDTDSGT